MTNTRISDIEILEKRYPIIIREFSLRHGSGGAGLHPGGLGVTRIIECREPLTFSMISERRVTAPYGLKGGEDGESGQNLIKKIDTITGTSRIVSLGPRGLVKLGKGDQFIVKSPGGGGWGRVGVAEVVDGGQIEGDSRVTNGLNGSMEASTSVAPKQYPRATGSIHTYTSTQDTN
jgi:5-oxoprolinase (ATP-hydrolysing)